MPDLSLFRFQKYPKIEQNKVNAKLNSEAKSKMAILQNGLKWPNISKKSLSKEIWTKKVMEYAFLKFYIFS